MDLGSNFGTKLEPFLLMAKSLKGAAAAKLIQDATSAPGVFVFTELLKLPNIQELASSEQHSKFYSLLQLFSYKTFQDYIDHKDVLQPLNSAQTTKLKQLTIVTLASEKRILPYSYLLQVLQMPTIRDLEDLIIDAIYLDLLRGKLDQKEEQLEVEYTMGRDLEPGKIEDILKTLKTWASRTSAVLAGLDTQLNTIASQATAVKVQNEENERALSMILKDVLDRQKDRGMSGVSSGARRTPLGPGSQGGSTLGSVVLGEKDKDSMDVDDENVRPKNPRKSVQDPTMKSQRKRNKF